MAKYEIIDEGYDVNAYLIYEDNSPEDAVRQFCQDQWLKLTYQDDFMCFVRNLDTSECAIGLNVHVVKEPEMFKKNSGVFEIKLIGGLVNE